jgi:hypothetical protein
MEIAPTVRPSVAIKCWRISIFILIQVNFKKPSIYFGCNLDETIVTATYNNRVIFSCKYIKKGVCDTRNKQGGQCALNVRLWRVCLNAVAMATQKRISFLL